MTRPKPSYSTTNLQTPICTVQLACDGINLVGAARERGYCNPCGEAAKKRGRVIPPRGENSALPVEHRRIIDALKQKEKYFQGEEFQSFVEYLKNPDGDEEPEGDE